MSDNEKNETARMMGIDAVAGIMILNMISYHCYSLPFHIFLSFFMPWFFFKSGMFYKRQSFKDCVQKSAKKLLYPFFTFTILGYLVYVLIFLSEGNHELSDYFIIPLKELVLDGSIYGNKPLWFLFSFFIVQVIFSVVENNMKYPIFIIIPAIIIVYTLFLYDNPLPRYFGNVNSGLVFYTLGYVLRKKQFSPYVSVTAIITYILFVIFGITFVDMFPNILRQGIYLHWFVFAIAGCITINSIFERIPYRFELLSCVGRNSMVLYVTHYLVIRLYYVVTEPFDINSKLRLVGLFIIVPIVEYLLVQLFKSPKMQFLLRPVK